MPREGYDFTFLLFLREKTTVEIVLMQIKGIIY
jgi:hypothetical protein